MAKIPLSKSHPEYAALLVDRLLTDVISAGSHRKVEWRCNGHTFIGAPSNITRGQWCSYCANKQVLVGFNNVGYTNAAVASMMVNPEDADCFVQTSEKSTLFRCRHGHEYVNKVNNVTKAVAAGGDGCLICANRTIIPGLNDLATLDPTTAAMMVHPERATLIGPGSTKPEEFFCKLGHTWPAKPSVVVKRKASGCPYCENVKLLTGFNDIGTTHPDYVRLMKNSEDATRFMAGSRTAIEWLCELGHVVAIPPSRKILKSEGCAKCSGRQFTSERSLAVTHPHVVIWMKNKSLADVITASSHEFIELFCGQGHEWTAKASSVASRLQCPGCNGSASRLRFKPASRLLVNIGPEIAAEAVDQGLVSSLTAMSDKRIEWRCKDCAHLWTAPPQSRSRGHGCPRCHPGAFKDDSTQAILYLYAPPPDEHLIYGKVQSPERLAAAEDKNYRNCALIAQTKPAEAKVVSAAESEIHRIKGRPKGRRSRSIRESMVRSPESVKAWQQIAESRGLEIEWSDFDWSTLEPVVDRQSACSCASGKQTTISDSKNPCCVANRLDGSMALDAGHYLGRTKTAVHHFNRRDAAGNVVAVMTLGSGASPSAANSLAQGSGVRALELTRLWMHDSCSDSLSRFVSECLSLINYPLYVYSYADANQGHSGGIYRACSFNYSGWSDMSRSQQLRETRGGFKYSDGIIVAAKHRYWTLVGVRGKRRLDLLAAAGWQSYDHRILGFSPPAQHRRVSKSDLEAAKIAPR